MSQQRDAQAAGRFFERAMGATKVTPTEVVTDRAATYPIVMDDLLPAAWHRTEQDANNHVEADHGRLNGCNRCEDSNRTLAPGATDCRRGLDLRPARRRLLLLTAKGTHRMIPKLIVRNPYSFSLPAHRPKEAPC